MPEGVLIFKWDKELGPVLISTYPENLIYPKDFQNQLYNTYKYTGIKPGFGTISLKNFKLLFYFTGLEDEFFDVDKYIVALLLKVDEKTTEFKDQLQRFAENIIPNLNDNMHVSTIKQLRNRIYDINNIINQKKAELQNLKIKIPDPDELKNLINQQEVLIKEKEKLVELTNSQILQLEKEIDGYKNSNIDFDKNLDDILNEIANLKTQISEKDTLIKVKEFEIKDVQNELERLQFRIPELSKTFEQLQNTLHKKNLQAMENRIKIEKDLEEKILKEKESAYERIKELEKQISEKKVLIIEKQKEISQLKNLYTEASTRFEEASKKMDDITKEIPILEAKLIQLNKQMEELKQFHEDKSYVNNIFEKLVNFLEKEPIYKIYSLLYRKGALTLSEFKNELSIPTITLKKYLQKYIDEGIIKQIDEEKYILC